VQGGIIIASTTPATATSGGGGGGYVTGEESKSMTFIDLTAGMFNTMSIDTDKISFSEIKFSVKNNVQNDVKIKVSGLGSKPADVNDLNNVYQWLEITHTNLENNNIASAKIKFSVKKSWLSSLGISQGDVILQRFDNGWHELQTNRIGEDADVVKYEASTPGFSIFAITPKSAPPVQTPVEQEPSETPVPSPTPTTGQTTSQPTGQFESPFKTDATAISIIIVVIVIIIFLGYLNYHRHPARRR
jgi:PGF-pre-PGF domain-containing protein